MIPLSTRVRGAAVLAAFFALPPGVTAGTDLSVVPDARTLVSGLDTLHNEVLGTDRVSFWQKELAALSANVPAGAAIDAMARIAPNRVYFSLDSDAIIAGTEYADEDIVFWDGSSYSLAWDGSANGLPDSADLDALDVVSLAPFEFSFSLDATSDLPGVGVVEDEDAVRWRQGAGFVQVDFDGSAQGVEPGLNLDGFGRRSADEWLLSFDSAGTIGALAFDDADILSFDPTPPTFAPALFFTAFPQVPAEVDLRAPTGCQVPVLTASPNGNNRIDLAWTGPLKTTTVERARDVPPLGPFASIGTVTANSFSDFAAHGGITYHYRVSNECGTSVVAIGSTTGSCGLPPDFAGASSVTQIGGSVCTAVVSWPNATSPCGGGVRYAVYRDTTSGFPPDLAHRLAAGLGGNNYTDSAGLGVSTYRYIVRATADINGAEDTNTVEQSVAITSCTPGGPAPVQFFDARSGDAANVLDWVNPGPSYATTHIAYRTDGTLPACPAGGAPDAVVPGSPFTGTAGARDRITHSGLTNGTSYTYAACVADAGGRISTVKKSFARPISVAGNEKWGYAMGASSLATAGVIRGVSYYAVSNDRVLHATAAGTGGGMWPPAPWIPYATNAPVQGRPNVVNLPTTNVAGVSRLAVLGSQDGRVYLVNALNGGGPALWTSALGTAVQATPAGMFRDFGGAYDLLFVGTRESVADSQFYALHLQTGFPAWTFDNGGGPNGIGIISATAAVDYATRRVYFTSRRRGGGSPNTVWCLSFTDSSRTLEWARDIGDSDTAPSLRGGVVYVGNNLGEVHAFDAITGTPKWGTPYATGDGPVKGFVWTDGPSNRLYFSTTNKVHAIQDIGASATPYWTGGVASGGAIGFANPSPLLLVSGVLYFGAGNSRVYAVQAYTPTPATPGEAVLGDPLVTKIVGAPTYDNLSSLILMGTDQGVVYGLTVPTTPASCLSIKNRQPTAADGPYTIAPPGSAPFSAFCDQTTDGGGWTLALKTDASSTAHYAAVAVNAAALATPTLDSVSKLDDQTIRALQGSTGPSSETRVESPSPAMQLLARSNGWSMFPYPGFPQIIQAKGSVAGSYISGAQCYDGTPAPCAADHYCIGIDFTTSEHACVRRFGTAGLFFNGGSFTGGYFPGRIWIR